MKFRPLFSILVLSVCTACAAEAGPAQPAAGGPQIAGRRVLVLPPEAFTVPTNHLGIVNLNNAVDAAWLDEHCEYMRRQLQVSVKARTASATSEELNNIPQLAARLRAEDPAAPMFLILAKGEGLPSILAEPYGYWGFMDAGWVEQGGGDKALVLDRMGKRLFQTLGFVIGAGNRTEREAVMRYTPTPEALDDCLSHGFHPLNGYLFTVAAKGVGLQAIRLRPRAELIELGILKPSTNAPAARPSAAPAAAAAQ